MFDFANFVLVVGVLSLFAGGFCIVFSAIYMFVNKITEGKKDE